MSEEVKEDADDGAFDINPDAPRGRSGTADRAVFRNPIDFDDAVENIEVLRGSLMFEDFNEVFSKSPAAEQYFVLAMASLDQARSFLRLASLSIPNEEEVGP